MTNLQLQANQFRESVRHNKTAESNDAYKNQTGRLEYEMEKAFQPQRFKESQSKIFSNYASPIAKAIPKIGR